MGDSNRKKPDDEEESGGSSPRKSPYNGEEERKDNCGYAAMSRAIKKVDGGPIANAKELFEAGMTKLKIAPDNDVTRLLSFPLRDTDIGFPDGGPFEKAINKSKLSAPPDKKAFTLDKMADSLGLTLDVIQRADNPQAVDDCFRALLQKAWDGVLPQDRFPQMARDYLKRQEDSKKPKVFYVGRRHDTAPAKMQEQLKSDTAISHANTEQQKFFKQELCGDKRAEYIIATGDPGSGHFINLTIDPVGVVEAFDAQKGIDIRTPHPSEVKAIARVQKVDMAKLRGALATRVTSLSSRQSIR